MGIPESFFQNNRLADPDDMDALLELAEMTRGLIAEGDSASLERLVGYAAEKGLCEAFTWIMGLVQEELEGDSLPPGELFLRSGGVHRGLRRHPGRPGDGLDRPAQRRRKGL